MNYHQFHLIVFIWELSNFSEIVAEKTCALNKLFVCPDGETCKEVNNSASLGICECKNKFMRIYPSGICIKQTDSDHSTLPSSKSVDSSENKGSTVILGFIIVLLLIALFAGLAFAAKKYKWLHRVREKAQQMVPRGQYPVLVSQEDDPPLA